MTHPTHASAQPTAPVIVAVIPEEGGDAVMRRAIELARESDAGVILYHAAAGKHLLDDPLPNQWSAHGEEEQFGDRLTPNDLEAAGRAPLARQVRAARDAGVQAWGWLPTNADAASLRQYAGEQGATTVVVDEGSELGSEIRAVGDIRVEVAEAD